MLFAIMIIIMYQSLAQANVDYPVKPWDQWVIYPGSSFGDHRAEGYHSGVDLNLPTGDRGLPVYAIDDGQVYKIDDRGSLGWSVVIKHTSLNQLYTIPARQTQDYQYTEQKINVIFSVYIHINPVSKLKKKITQPDGTTVTKGEIIGYIYNLASGAHLHFEIRNSNAQHSNGGSMLLPISNWAPNGTENNNGHYINMQKLVESGARHPLDFLQANVGNIVPIVQPCLVQSPDSGDVYKFRVYWLQNNKLYWITDMDIINNKMANIPRWDKIGQYPSNQLNGYLGWPGEENNMRFIVADSRSEGLLIRQQGRSEVYVVKDGKRRWIQTMEAIKWLGANWEPDIIEVTSSVISKYVPNQGADVYDVGRDAPTQAKDEFISAYKRAQVVQVPGFPGSWSEYLRFPTEAIRDAKPSGYSGITGKYQVFDEGMIYWTEKYGAFETHGAIFMKYRELGGSANKLGFPVSDEHDWQGNRRSDFEGGYIYWIPSTNETKVYYKNTQPVVSDIPDQTIDEGESFATIKLDDYVSDPDNTDAEIKWTVTGNTKLTVAISNDRVATITVSDPEWSGSEILTFTATDPGGLKTGDTAKFTVNPVNDPPVVIDIPDQTINEGGTFPAIKLDDFVSDPDNADAEIKWTVTGNTKLTVAISNDRVATITVSDPEWSGSEILTFTATDPGGLKTGDTAKFTVNPVNDPPVVIDIPDQTINEGGTFPAIKLDDFVSDPDNTDAEIKWSVFGNTKLVVNIDNSHIATIKVSDPEWNGSEILTFTAEDLGGLKASDTAKFTVSTVNDPPVVTNIPDQTIDEGKAFATIKLDDYVSDPDNTDAEMKWTVTGNTKLVVNVDNSRIAAITMSDPEWNGSETITFTATDPGGLKASDTAKFTVSAVNDPPVVADIPDQTIDEGGTLTAIKLDDYVSDPDNTDAEMKWTVTGNTKLTFAISNDRVATITATDPEWNGSEMLTFTAEDPGGLKASDSAKFTVNAVNDPPVVTDIPDQTINEGGTFTTIKLDDYVSDPDNTDAEIKWTVTGNTKLTVAVDSDRVATITVSDPEWNGSEILTFTAEDPGGLKASDTAKFTVSAVNDPPVVIDIPDQTIDEGGTFATIKLDDYVSDPDNTDAEMKWSVTDNTKLTVAVDKDRVATITVSDPKWNGSETLTFTAEDPGGLKASDTAKFTVNPVNDPPVVKDIPDQTIDEGATFSTIKLDDYVSDPDNTDAEIKWSVTGNTKLTVAVDNDRVATITVSAPEWNGKETLTFTAEDPNGLKASDTAKFTVNAVNDPPVVTDIPDQTIIACQPFTNIELGDYVTDVDNANSEISWTVTGNSKVSISIDADRVAVITIADPDWRGSEVVTFTAKDSTGLSASDTVNFTVKVLLGDVNKDCAVKPSDAIIALQIAAGLKEPNDYEKVAADMTGDGKILANDAIKILQAAVGLGAPDMNFPAVKKPITLALSDLHGTAGDTVILPLNVDNTNNLAGGDICIVYNNTILQALEVSSTSNVLMVSKISDPGVIRVSFAGSGKLNESNLANVKFKVLSDGISPLKFKSVELYGFDGNSVSLVFTDKEFRSWAVAPERSALLQNYPNPFNPETWIPFQLKEGSNVNIRIYNLSGELVRELEVGYKPAGVYVNRDRAIYWDGKDKLGQSVANGVYFYNINAGSFNAVKKLVILK